MLACSAVAFFVVLKSVLLWYVNVLRNQFADTFLAEETGMFTTLLFLYFLSFSRTFYSSDVPIGLLAGLMYVVSNHNPENNEEDCSKQIAVSRSQ